MKRSIAIALLVLLVSACNDGSLVADHEAEPDLVRTTVPPPDPTPTATPIATPIACHFYGVDSDGLLWDIDPEAASATLVGPTATTSVTDLAITADGKIVAIEAERAYLFDPATAAVTDLSATPWVTGQNALDVMPDGRLLVGGLGELAAVDLATGVVEALSTLPAGFKFSGDIAAIDGEAAFATASAAPDQPDQLMHLDVASGGATTVGNIGAHDVWGLDFGCDGFLYGLADGGNGPPQLLRIDTVTGVGTLVASFPGGPDGLWGASGPAR